MLLRNEGSQGRENRQPTLPNGDLVEVGWDRVVLHTPRRGIEATLDVTLVGEIGGQGALSGRGPQMDAGSSCIRDHGTMPAGA